MKRTSLPELRVITSALASSLGSLPYTIRDSGCIVLSPESSRDQLESALRLGYDHSTIITTQMNFYEGDLWNLITERYGGGIDFMRKVFGTDLAEKMSIRFRGKGKVARRCKEPRDLTESWRHYIKLSTNCRSDIEDKTDTFGSTMENLRVEPYEGRLHLQFTLDGEQYRAVAETQPFIEPLCKLIIDPRTGQARFDPAEL